MAARSSREAGLEDAAEFAPERDVYALWASVSQPTLLLRAGRGRLPGYGVIVSAVDAQRFAREVPSARVVEVDANHYGIITAEATAAANAEFFASWGAWSREGEPRGPMCATPPGVVLSVVGHDHDRAWPRRRVYRAVSSNRGPPHARA